MPIMLQIEVGSRDELIISDAMCRCVKVLQAHEVVS